MNLQNPFIGRGIPVSGERLVGRTNELHRIKERITHNAHCSIVGLPRIGKTSLAKEVLSSIKHSHISYNSYLTLDSLSGQTQVYSMLIKELYANIGEDVPDFHPKNDDDSYEFMVGKLRALKKKGTHSIVVLDELDAILRENFQGSRFFVSRIREIANDHDKYGLTFIFISRRPLDFIQGEIDCSTLAGLCEVIYLKPLQRDGLLQLANRSPIPVKEDGFLTLWKFTGGNPYLAEVLMCEAVEKNYSKIDQLAMEQVLEIQAHEFINQYQLLEKILSYDYIFESLCELTVGPYWRNIPLRTVFLLKNYGLIKQEDDNVNGYICMSQHLQDYLSLKTREKPTWSILGEVEQLLRVVIRDKLETKYGVNWVQELISRHNYLQDVFDRLKKQKLYETKTFGNAAPDNILDYAYIRDLVSILFCEWDQFLPLLHDSKETWNKRFKDIQIVRNRLAHHRQIPDDLVKNAEHACKHILKKLR